VKRYELKMMGEHEKVDLIEEEEKSLQRRYSNEQHRHHLSSY